MFTPDVVALIPFFLYTSFTNLCHYLLMYVQSSPKTNTQEKLSADLGSYHNAVLPLSSPYPQQILAILAFLNFHLCLLYSARLLGFDRVSVCSEAWEANLDNCSSHLICFLFSGITVLGCYLSENYYSMYSVYICSCLRCEGKI